MIVTSAQEVIFQHLAEGTDFILNVDISPKAEFSRLALVKGWIGGDAKWKENWLQLFEEVYPYNPRPHAVPRWLEDDQSSEATSAQAHEDLESALSDEELRYRRAQDYETRLEACIGDDVDKLEAWQRLCRVVLIDPIPTSITRCKKALQEISVNLFDLVDHMTDRKSGLKLWSDYAAFRKYTLKGKVFPKEAAKEEGFIKVFLREIWYRQRRAPKPAI